MFMLILVENLNQAVSSLWNHMDAIIGLAGTVIGVFIGYFLTRFSEKQQIKRQVKSYASLITYNLLSLIEELANIKKQFEERLSIAKNNIYKESRDNLQKLLAEFQYIEQQVSLNEFGKFSFTAANDIAVLYYKKIYRANALYKKRLEKISKSINGPRNEILNNQDKISELAEEFANFIRLNGEGFVEEIEKIIVYIEHVLKDWQKEIMQKMFGIKPIIHDRHNLDLI